jgi:hypothetical protein
MAIEFSSVFGTISNGIYSIPFMNTILSSVLYTSIILSILLIIVIMFIYPGKKNSSSWVLVKLFIYLTIANVVVLSAHHSIMNNKYKERDSNDDSVKFIDNISKRGGNVVYANDSVQVIPRFEEREYVEDPLTSDQYNQNGGYQPEIREITASQLLDDI